MRTVAAWPATTSNGTWRLICSLPSWLVIVSRGAGMPAKVTVVPAKVVSPPARTGPQRPQRVRRRKYWRDCPARCRARRWPHSQRLPRRTASENVQRCPAEATTVLLSSKTGAPASERPREAGLEPRPGPAHRRSSAGGFRWDRLPGWTGMTLGGPLKTTSAPN